MGVTDDVIRTIAENCPNLTGIDVSGCENLTDAALEAVSVLGNLIWVAFSNTQVEI